MGRLYSALGRGTFGLPVAEWHQLVFEADSFGGGGFGGGFDEVDEDGVVLAEAGATCGARSSAAERFRFAAGLATELVGSARLRALASKTRHIILWFMATITEVEKLALDLPESQRAVLAAHLLRSLPSVLHDEDEGIAEALRRDAELDANPSSGISLEQLDQQIERRRI